MAGSDRRFRDGSWAAVEESRWAAARGFSQDFQFQKKKTEKREERERKEKKRE